MMAETFVRHPPTSHEPLATSHESLYNETIITKGWPVYAAYT
jgi:hypothetical protein